MSVYNKQKQQSILAPEIYEMSVYNKQKQQSILKISLRFLFLAVSFWIFQKQKHLF